jgi:hypothetical protein
MSRNSATATGWLACALVDHPAHHRSGDRWRRMP